MISNFPEASSATTDDAAKALAASHLYDAECALHIAHQTHVDEWIAAAGDRLHDAIVEHRAAASALATSSNRYGLATHVA